MYSWNHFGASGVALATSSIELVLIVLSVKATFRLAAARAFATSPSGCAIRCMAVGEIPIGIENRSPKTVQDRSLTEPPCSIRGRIRKRSKPSSSENLRNDRLQKTHVLSAPHWQSIQAEMPYHVRYRRERTAKLPQNELTRLGVPLYPHTQIKGAELLWRSIAAVV
uniref:Uncharacterized protein n=1 Tax=Anopheles farauti TaxID=69004 RepID=A0A182Q1K1_9DIPT